jgi:hypothetical protein
MRSSRAIHTPSAPCASAWPRPRRWYAARRQHHRGPRAMTRRSRGIARRRAWLPVAVLRHDRPTPVRAASTACSIMPPASRPGCRRRADVDPRFWWR